MNKLVVKTDKLQFFLLIFLGLFFVPMGLWQLSNFLFYGFKLVPLIVGLMSLSVFGIVFWLVSRGYYKSVRYFNDEGLLRNDGKQLIWKDLYRVVYQIRTRPGMGSSIWRIEIHFKSGECAWLIPIKVSNFIEVRNYVENLPCEQTNVDV